MYFYRPTILYYTILYANSLAEVGGPAAYSGLI